MKEHKFTPGAMICDFTAFIEAYRDGRWIYVRHNNKPLHPQFYAQWPLELIARFIQGHLLRIAEPVKEIGLKEFVELVTTSKGTKVEWISQEDYDAWVKE